MFSPVQRAKRRAFRQLQAGQLISAVLTCDRILKADPKDTLALRVLADVAGTMTAAVEKFKQDPSDRCERVLRKIRLDYVDLLDSSESALPLAGSPMAQAYNALMASGLRDLPRNAEETATFDKLREQLAVADFAVDEPVLLAAMLLCFNFELPLPKSLKTIAANVRDGYCHFLLDSPLVLRYPGDADRCGVFLAEIMNFFHKEVIVGQTIVQTTEARKLANIATNRARFLQAYFTALNLRPMMQLRGDLMSCAQIAAGATVLKALPPRQSLDKKIRLGVLTTLYAAHTDAHFTASHIDNLDRARFHIILYVFKATGHTLERHCISRADQFVVLPATGVQAQAERIRADDLDILLFGVNQTAMANPPAWLGCLRLARTQIATASSPVTTGLRHIDVMLSAADNEIGQEAQSHYTEQLWLMPGSVNVYAYQYDTEPATVSFTRGHLNIAADTIVFFSGANFFKIIPELSLTWAKILAGVPNSVLVLMPFNPNWTDNYRAAPFVNRIKSQLMDLGVSPDRLRMIDPVPARADVYRVVATADIYLDAYPFAGACSMLDPIIMAVPPVVRSGTVGRSLHGATLMRTAGVNEVICASEESYISTAIDLAVNPARRTRIRTALNAVNARQPQPFFDTGTFSSNVGQALTSIHTQYLATYRRFRAGDALEQRRLLQILAGKVLNQSLELSALIDIGIVQSIIKPYFEHKKEVRQRHMVDVGACQGVMAEPLLTDGWSADLFEPDPRARSALEHTIGKYGSRCRIFGMAVTSSDAAEVAFHQTQTGLSGLGESPFGATEAVLTVACTRLDNFYAGHNVKFVDFLNIDAEGFDFDVLASHDFSLMQPSIVMVEYGTHFETESLPVINQAIARMAEAGYGSVVFNYFDDGNFSEGKFIYRLTHILIDQALPDIGRTAFGNILFYRSDDVDFLETLYALLDVCRPRVSSGH